jgi:hypothetical protein
MWRGRGREALVAHRRLCGGSRRWLIERRGAAAAGCGDMLQYGSAAAARRRHGRWRGGNLQGLRCHSRRPAAKRVVVGDTAQ